MSIFPFVNGQDGAELIKEKKDLTIFKEIAWDFILNKPIFENGDFKIVTRNEALKVWIYKAIKTDRFALEIYSWNYGSEINSIINKGYSKDFTDTEIKRYIEEALLTNKYIKSLKFRNIIFNEDILKVDIEVKSIYSEFRFKF